MNNNVNDKDYIPLTPFKRWTLENFPFIEADFDAITNYQLYCKIVEYLNNVISNQNQVQELGTELVTAYNQLLDYVNNYFDNLDVQDEINNKLDAMAEDGSLTNLIKAYIDPFIEEQNEEISSFKDNINNQINLQNSIINGLSMTPLVASSTSEMTNTSRIYVNTTDGKWYYYDGDSWEIGGTYQSTAIDNVSYEELDTNLKNLVDTNIDFDKIITSTVSTSISTTKNDSVFTTKLTGINYNRGYTLLNDDYYIYNGFKLLNVASSPNLGLVIGLVDNDPEDFLFMIVSQSQTGSIYRMNHGTNTGKVGSFTNVSNTKDLIITSLTNNVLSFKTISTSNQERLHTYDLTSITDTIYPIIAFAPFSTSETTYNYELVLYPYYNYNDVMEALNELENKYINNALYDIFNKGIKNGTSLKIKLLGDSITAGYGGTGYDVSESGGGDLLFWDRYQNILGTCWANSLKEYVEDKYSNITIDNYGVSGANIYNLNQYYDSVPLVKNDDDIVIVMIGTNDRDNTKSNYMLQLQSLYNKIKQSNKKMIIMTSIPASSENESEHTLHMEDIAMFNESFAYVNNIPFINVYDEFNKYCLYTNTSLSSLLTDGLHPNDDGYQVMFEIISNALGFVHKR